MRLLKIFLPLFLFGLTTAYAQPELELVEIANGFSNTVKITHAGDDRLFVVERSGRIRILTAEGNILSTPFLDIDDRVILTGGQSEQGLLGLAFHPDYSNTGFFYVHYTNNSGNSEIARFSVTANDPNVADPNSELSIMSINQPFGNHNGGEIAFGPDGYLYIGMGDGGSGNDPGNRAQNPQSEHGKMLRIDIGQEPYAVPSDNPFVNNSDFLPEIWSWGLRNPWRFSFDALTGDLWMADVGQWDWEEIDFQPANSTGGENYGWRCREGEVPNPNVNTSACGPLGDYVQPIFTYSNVQFGPCSVTGGFVYRGCELPDLYGYYVYADFCSGDIWGLLRDDQGNVTNELLKTISTGAWTTFGEGIDGEMYLAGLNNARIYKLTTSEAIGDITINEDLGTLSIDGTFDTYQWYLDGAIIPGAEGATHTATASGVYTVEVGLEKSGCSYTADETTVIITSTNTISGLQDFQLQPNPFKEELILHLSLAQPSPLDLTVYSMDGKIVYQQRLAQSDKWSEKLDLSDLESAVYLLRVSNGTEELVKKIIKE